MTRAKRKSRARQKPSNPPGFTGDHGTATQAAMAGTVLEAMKNEDGSNPNNIGRRRRLSAIEALSLTMRQEQAAREIEKAWCGIRKLQSGGALKEQVDASPKPDAVVAAQVEAQSRWSRATKALLRSEREIVFHVCCDNLPIVLLSRRLGITGASERFKTAMDRVADYLRY